MNEPYPGWLRSFEAQKRLSSERRMELGQAPISEETWERWRKEMLCDLDHESITTRKILPPL